MLEVRNRQRFPLPRASGRCGFGEVTFAGTHGNDEDAPIPAVRANTIDRLKSTQSGRRTMLTSWPRGSPPEAPYGRLRFTPLSGHGWRKSDNPRSTRLKADASRHRATCGPLTM
jgi:hypothetical protein